LLDAFVAWSRDENIGPPIHPKGTKARILLTSVFGPYARDDEYGSRSINPMELYHNQVTRAQGSFSLRMFYRSWGIMMIQRKISAPCTVIDFPTLEKFEHELRENQYDVVGISSIVGLEHHTPKNVEQEIEYAIGHGTDFHQFMLYTPIPGTHLHQQMAEEGRMIDGVDLADIHGQFNIFCGLCSSSLRFFARSFGCDVGVEEACADFELRMTGAVADHASELGDGGCVEGHSVEGHSVGVGRKSRGVGNCLDVAASAQTGMSVPHGSEDILSAAVDGFGECVVDTFRAVAAPPGPHTDRNAWYRRHQPAESAFANFIKYANILNAAHQSISRSTF
jgi:hypothetical protein